jgi:ribonucleoside-triphosphate reductase
MEDLEKARMFPAYDAGFIALSKQFSTIGINGMVEAAEYMNCTPNNNEKYKMFVSRILRTINEENKKAKQHYGFRFNTELVPAENLGTKNAKWDRDDLYFVLQFLYLCC